MVKELQGKCEKTESELLKAKETLEKYKKVIQEHGIDISTIQ